MHLLKTISKSDVVKGKAAVQHRTARDRSPMCSRLPERFTADKSSYRSKPAMAATTQFCATAELLELVLLDLDLDTRDILLSQRASKSFRNVITGSQALQRKMFMLADPTPPEEERYGTGPGQRDPNTNLRHKPKNRNECDQTGDEQARYHTREIDGKVFTLDRSPPCLRSVQPWKSYIVTKRGQWQQWQQCAQMDWNSEKDVSMLHKWRTMTLSRHGWPQLRAERGRRADPDPTINDMLDLLTENTMSAGIPRQFPLLRAEDSVLRTEASWRKMLTSRPPSTTVLYSSKYIVPEKDWEVRVRGKIMRDDGVRAGEVIDDVLEHAGTARPIQVQINWSESLLGADGRAKCR
ncbi:hypothetical protein LTR78_009446 [Recurvomyces mirabilis]|uniref:F-box domain-containing protein n=1 Tax=Recurvomyces mirabilis TaxID=574656 RepID=A0AAE0WFC7_9PEZI|nr:hypothetical protein LTR78_009446 [Recurvomyces mirabilis]KAK5152351.1 hypothetical protein LTS14_008298 [Recurvomyces mirabilis]